MEILHESSLEDEIQESKNAILQAEQNNMPSPPIFECPICYTNTDMDVFTMECCNNKLCLSCYYQWHFQRNHESCAFCRQSSTQTSNDSNNSVDSVDSINIQIDDNTCYDKFLKYTLILIVCIIISMCVSFVCLSILVCYYKFS